MRDGAGTTEERFPASPAYALEIRAFEGELRGERSLLPDGADSVRTVASRRPSCRRLTSGAAWRCRHSSLSLR